MSYQFSPNTEKKFEWLKTRYPQRDAVLIPLLHFVQAELGYLSVDSIDYVAKRMELSPARVKEVASFYSLFRFKKGGRFTLQVCHNLSCYMRGSDEILSWLTENLKFDENGVSDDGFFSLERVECLASCSTGPVLQVNDWDYFEELNIEKVEKILSALREGKWTCPRFEDRVKEGSFA